MGSPPLQSGVGRGGVGVEKGTCRTQEVVTAPIESDATVGCVEAFLTSSGTGVVGVDFEK